MKTKIKTMENFFYEEEFCSDLGELIDYIGYEEEDIIEFDNDWYLEIYPSKLEKVFVATDKWLVDAVLRATDYFDDRFPEDSEDIMERIGDAIKKVVDIDRLNSLLPELYYPIGHKAKVTKQDLLDFIK